METNHNENYDGNNRNYQNPENVSENEQQNYENRPSDLGEASVERSENQREESDDFHKNDDLSHSQNGERIDRTGTDPNRYSNLASQDTGSEKSIYSDSNNVKQENWVFSESDSEADDDFDALDISDTQFSDEEQELRNNEANSFKSNSESDNRNSSPDNTFFNEGI